MLITTRQEPKETLETQVYRVYLDRMGGQVRAELSETRVQMEEEGLRVRRVQLECQELQDCRAAQVLQVHRVPEGSEVSLDPEDSPAFLDLRVDQDQSEAPEQPDAEVETDKRANQETPVIKVFQDH